MSRIRVFPSALAKALNHTITNIEKEVAGFLIGKVDGDTLSITDSTSARQIGTPTHVVVADEEQAEVAKRLEEQNRDEYIVGWYHSHPRMGAEFLSNIDIQTQRRYQNLLTEAVALVIDPAKLKADQLRGEEFRFYRLKNEGYREVQYTLVTKPATILTDIMSLIQRHQKPQTIIYTLADRLADQLYTKIRDEAQRTATDKLETELWNILAEKAKEEIYGFIVIWGLLAITLTLIVALLGSTMTPHPI